MQRSHLSDNRQIGLAGWLGGSLAGGGVEAAAQGVAGPLQAPV